MTSSRMTLLAGLVGGFFLAALLIVWPEVRGLCPACAPVAVSDIPSKHFVTVRKAVDLEKIFGDQMSGPRFPNGPVPRVYVRTLPADLAAVADLERRKQLFFRIMVPQILRLNEAIQTDRKRLIEIGRTDGPPPAADRKWVESLAQRYGATPTDRQTLLARVDIVPPSLAIAQAAIESGWGTSRFAQSGNAVFGQRTFDPDRAGLSPSDVQNANFRVRRFQSLMRSVWGYMTTLNTHPAHRDFRRLRAQMRRQGNALDSMALAGTLTRYSEEGERYVRLVRNVISANSLRSFDGRRLADGP